MEKHLFLLVDNFLSSLILPIHQGFAFKAMLYFKEYNNILPMLLYGMLGSCLGGVMNWVLGKTIFFIRTLYHANSNNEHKILQTFVICAVILFSWVPGLCGVIQVISGYLRLNIYILITAVFVSYLCYSLYLIFIT